MTGCPSVLPYTAVVVAWLRMASLVASVVTLIAPAGARTLLQRAPALVVSAARWRPAPRRWGSWW